MRRAFPDASKSDDNYTENLTDKVSVIYEWRKNCSAILFVGLTLIGKQTFSDLLRRVFPDTGKSYGNYTENFTDKVSVMYEDRTRTGQVTSGYCSYTESSVRTKSASRASKTLSRSASNWASMRTFSESICSHLKILKYSTSYNRWHAVLTALSGSR